MRRPRGPVAPLALAVALTLAGGGAVAGVRATRDAPAPRPPVSTVPYGVRMSRGEVPQDPAYVAARLAGANAVLAARSRALLARDRAAFLATLDRTDAGFVQRQERLFRGVAQVDLASWEYVVHTEEYLPYTLDWERYGGADVYVPSLSLRYAIRGYDPTPVARAVQLTFVQRDGRWLIGGDRDVRSGPENADDPWDVAEVTVVRGVRSVVIGHPRDRDRLRDVAAELDEAVPWVTARWGADWPQRVVAVAPRETALLESLFRGSTLGFDRFAAVAVAQFDQALDRLGAPRNGPPPLPVSGRIVVNPDNVDLDDDFLSPLLRHEVTHLAQFRVSRSATPEWLVEGFAEWVGYAAYDVPVRAVAPEATREVRAGRLPPALPFDADFGYTGDAGLAYQQSWLACRYVADRWGEDTLRELYRAVARRSAPLAVPQAFRQILGVTEERFLAGWHDYLRRVSR